nr:unnamed protein product [Haemonchus contortus]
MVGRCRAGDLDVSGSRGRSRAPARLKISRVAGRERNLPRSQKAAGKREAPVVICRNLGGRACRRKEEFSHTYIIRPL